MSMGVVAERRTDAFSRFAWGVLVYIFLVVLWGAYVRATGSGAGCGGHWPLCNGEIVPQSPAAATIIEYGHRLSSGLALMAVTLLCGWAFRLYPQRHVVRRFAALSIAFLVLEALLGMGLVLLDYVAKNASAGRAAYLSAHLVNTQILLAMLALTAWFSSVPGSVASLRSKPWPLVAALPVVMLVSVTGAIAALGDTLYPATSVAEGFGREIAVGAQRLLRLRPLHPLFALAGGAFVLFAAHRRPAGKANPRITAARLTILGLILLQWIAGALNIVLLAPVWMQIVHLLVANLLWVTLVILVAQIGRIE
jgi:heme a synthase